MKPEIKKLLILNAPYLLFVYLFDKLGEAVRLAPGADASQKLLHMGEGFTAAFTSYAPSFHPADLLIGIAGALLIRLAVYVKGKNAKKYRKGMEYGSARWGGPKDISSAPPPTPPQSGVRAAMSGTLRARRITDTSGATTASGPFYAALCTLETLWGISGWR